MTSFINPDLAAAASLLGISLEEVFGADAFKLPSSPSQLASEGQVPESFVLGGLAGSEENAVCDASPDGTAGAGGAAAGVHGELEGFGASPHSAESLVGSTSESKNQQILAAEIPSAKGVKRPNDFTIEAAKRSKSELPTESSIDEEVALTEELLPESVDEGGAASDDPKTLEGSGSPASPEIESAEIPVLERRADAAFAESQRVMLLPSRITGRIKAWKGKFGWITPDKPIQHPEAAKHRGMVYLAAPDVEAAISGVDARVSFFLYTDGHGLGAMNCRPFSNEERVTGRMLDWKGKYGWIQPDKPIKQNENSKTTKNKLYIAGEDVEEMISGVGARVSFLIYADDRGFGAMSCRPCEEGEGEIEDAETGLESGQATMNGSGLTRDGSMSMSMDGMEDAPSPASSSRPNMGGLPMGNAYNNNGANGGRTCFVCSGPHLARDCPLSNNNMAAAVAAAADSICGGGSGDFGNGSYGGCGGGGGGGGGGHGAQNFSGNRSAPVRGRERVSSNLMTGRIREWKRDFGWIVPDQPIDHPQQMGSRVYVHIDDMERNEAPALNAWVTFSLYVDRKGIGAENCRVSGGPDDGESRGGGGGPGATQQRREDPAAAVAAAMAAAAMGQPSPYIGKMVPPRFGAGAPAATSSSTTAATAAAPRMASPTMDFSAPASPPGATPGGGRSPPADSGGKPAAPAASSPPSSSPPAQAPQGMEAALAAWMSITD